MIIKRLDGIYEVIVQGQDTERAYCKTEEEAIRVYRNMFAFMSNLKVKDVDAPRVIDRSVWPTFIANEAGGFRLSGDEMDQALAVAAWSNSLKPGHRYEIRVQLVEVGEPPFQGEGI